MIPNDDPVRLLNVFVEGMELTDLYQTYGKIKKSQASPRQLFKIVIYAAMNRIYSSRDIECSCRRDINFMYLLEGKPAPDHATIARFISLHLSQCSKKTLAEVTALLKDLGEISGVHIFIDGTKIESAANRYTFVWKKAVTKLQKRLCEKIAVLVEEHLSFRYRDIVADAGYESEENYLYMEENGQVAFIKPNNYEKSKTQKYKKDIGRMENMNYDEEKDCYFCRNGKEIGWICDRRTKAVTGYIRTTSIYRCDDCKGCPHKAECIKGNNCKTPMEDRMKTLQVSKTMKQKRQEDLERITSDYGIQLRMNRSIQVEGSFANVKEDMGFRRYAYRGIEDVTAQSVILAIAHNVNKYHNKIQADKTGRHLFDLKESA